MHNADTLERTTVPQQQGAAQRIVHYRAYKPAPFTLEDREQATILFGGLQWRTERLIQGAIERFGYKTAVLPTATREDLLAGRELADIGQCCPTSFTTGNLAGFLRKESQRLGAAEVSRRYVHVTAGSCGSCRFGQYHQSYELALRNLDLESFRLFLLQQNALDQGEAAGQGLDLSPQLMTGVFWAVLMGDVLQDLEYQIRPYEVHAGETERVARESVERLHEALRSAPLRGGRKSGVLWYLLTGHFTAALREVYARYAAIEVDRLRVKPLVKITGEFYLQTVEGEPNYNIHRWLEAEGAEVYPAAISIWIDYLLRLAAQEAEDRIGVRRGARVKRAGAAAVQGLLRWNYDRMRAARDAAPGGVARVGRALLPQPAERRRGRHAGRQGAVGAPEEEGAHDLRALALFLHAQHHERGSDGRGPRPAPGRAVRAAGDQGRCRGARAVALPDDPHRSQAPRAARVRRGAGAHRPHAGVGAGTARRPSGQAGRLQGAARRRRRHRGQSGAAPGRDELRRRARLEG